MDYKFNVLCDKPLARSVDAMVETARKNNVNLYVFQQSRCAPFYREMKRILESGILGRIIQISISYSGFSRRWDWQTVQAFNGGNLFNTGPHPLDHAVDLYGEGLPEVRCFMDRVNTFGDAEDYCKIILSGEAKPVVDIEVSSCKAFNPFNYNIQCSRGGLVSDTSSIQYKYFEEDECEKQQLVLQPLSDSEQKPAYCSEKINWHEEKWEGESEEFGTFAGRTANFYKMIYDHIERGKELEVKLSEVREKIAIIEECHKQNSLDRFIEPDIA